MGNVCTDRIPKARTHRQIFRGLVAESALESADSSPESADSTTDSVIVGRLHVLNMFNISTLIESADLKLVKWVHVGHSKTCL